MYFCPHTNYYITINYKNNDLGTYTVYVYDDMSHNHILISSKDLTILNRVFNSLKARVIVTDDELENLHAGNSSNDSKYY